MENKIKFKGVILSDLDKYPDNKEKDEVLLSLKNLHKPLDEYGENGLRFTDDWIKEVGGFIIKMPLEYIADYIHISHKTKLDNKDKEQINGLKDFIKNPDLFYWFMYMKPQILGVLAYGILNVKDNEEAVYCATKILNMYYDYHLYQACNDREGISKMVDEHKEYLLSLN